MTAQFKAATIRALYGAILLAAATFLAALQVAEFRTSETIADAGIAAGVTFIGYMIARGMAEGLIDSNRAPTSADVGQPPR